MSNYEDHEFQTFYLRAPVLDDPQEQGALSEFLEQAELVTEGEVERARAFLTSFGGTATMLRALAAAARLEFTAGDGDEPECDAYVSAFRAAALAFAHIDAATC